MLITKQIQNLIIAEYEAFKSAMYAGKSKAERDILSQFFTPPEISIKLLEAYNTDSLAGKIIRDPACGSGNLLAACIIAGADPENIFGNDFDACMVTTCRQRLHSMPDRIAPIDANIAERLRTKLLKFNDWQIHKGDALKEICLTEFGPDYKQKLTEYFTYENTGGQYSLFDDDLTPTQEKFLSEVD